MIYLDPRKVARVFGPRPWLGRRIPIVLSHQVNVVIALMPVRGKPGYWELQCDHHYVRQATQWLMETFYPSKPVKGPTPKAGPRKLTSGYDYKQGRWRRK